MIHTENGESTKVFTNAEKNAFGELMRKQYHAKGYTAQEQLSSFADIAPTTTARLLRTITDKTTFANAVKFCLALDIDIYEVIRILNLDTTVLERMEDSQYGGYFKNLCWMKEGTSPAAGPIDELLKDVPEDRRELGRTLIEKTLDSLR